MRCRGISVSVILSPHSTVECGGLVVGHIFIVLISYHFSLWGFVVFFPTDHGCLLHFSLTCAAVTMVKTERKNLNTGGFCT